MKNLKLFSAIVALGCAALFVSCSEDFKGEPIDGGNYCKVTIKESNGTAINDVWVTVTESGATNAYFSAASLGTFDVPISVLNQDGERERVNYNIHISWISDDKPKVLYSTDVAAPNQSKATIKLAKGGYDLGGEKYKAQADTIR